MDYRKLLKDPRWQKKRLEILERDNFTCRDTGATDEELHVHHCWYARGAPWETPNEYLLTLCASAHKFRQDLERRAKDALGLLMAKTPCHDGDEDDLLMLVSSMEDLASMDAPVSADVVLSSVYNDFVSSAHENRFNLTWFKPEEETRRAIGLPAASGDPVLEVRQNSEEGK